MLIIIIIIIITNHQQWILILYNNPRRVTDRPVHNLHRGIRDYKFKVRNYAVMQRQHILRCI